MTDTNLVRIPWHDGTTREVPEGTLCLMGGAPMFAVKGGFILFAGDKRPHSWDGTKVSKVYAEAPEPPVVVEVPAGIGAVVASAGGYLYVHHRSEWRRDDGSIADDMVIKSTLNQGGRVLSKGINPEQVA